MAVYQLRSSQSVIAKTKRDMRISRDDWINDAIEWMGEALDAIGTLGQLVDKARVVKTSSHRAPLPSDLYMLKGVYYGHGNKEKDVSDLTLEDFPMFMEYGSADLHPAVIEEVAEQETGAQRSVNETYLINGQYIQTSFESDYIAIFYKAFPLDDDGFPMLPDMYEFSQALYWYIVMKLLEGGENHPSGEIGWQVARQEWLRYCGQARAQANMPDIGKAAHFRDMWVKLVPDWNRNFKNYDQQDLSLDDLKSGNVQTRPLQP